MMAQSIQTRRLTLALMAQVVLCLSFAPVVGAAAQAAQSQSDSRQHDESPRGNGTMQAARDAANARPEESTENEKSSFRGVRRSTALRWRQARASNSYVGIHQFGFNGPSFGAVGIAAAHDLLSRQPILRAISCASHANICQVVFIGQSLQPTGPPIID